MHITEIPNATIQQLVFEASPVRSEGLHLSTIIRSILCDLDPATYTPTNTLDWNRMELGFAFERVLEHAFTARREDIVRPGEFVKDGIIGSPDGISAEDWVLEEFKATWKSSADAPQGRKFWAWRVQMMAYCTLVGTERARLRALFVNGNYRNGYVPEFRAWNLTFSARELDDNWSMLVAQARAKGLL